MLAASEDVEIRLTLLNRIAEARRQTDKLFDLVRADALYERPIPERHRIIFYLGHLEAFDWNLLHAAPSERENVRCRSSTVFSHSASIRWTAVCRRISPRTGLRCAQIENYRDRVRTTLDAALKTGDFADWAEMKLRGAAERRHRASSDACRDAGVHAASIAVRPETKRASGDGSASRLSAVRTAMVEIPAGTRHAGNLARRSSFGWDNEYEATTVDVPAFTIDRYKVTNGRISGVRGRRWIPGTQLVDCGSLGLENSRGNRASAFLVESDGQTELALSSNVRGDPLAA